MSRSNTARLNGLLHRDTPWGNEPTPEYTPTFTLDRHVEQARAEMGETRWQQLQAEWDAPRLSAIKEGRSS